MQIHFSINLKSTSAAQFTFYNIATVLINNSLNGVKRPRDIFWKKGIMKKLT